jgi:hypothetical protein
MKPISLQDILPTKPEFSIEKTKKTYTLRLPNMLDQVWIKEKFGGPERVAQVIQGQDWLEISRIVYRLMDDAARGDFPAVDAKIINDDGESMQRRLTGPEHLLSCLSGLEETVRMLGALTQAIILSNPLIGEEVKKKLMAQGIRIGDTSLTLSKASTVSKKKSSRS